jgi:hypothetical protein
MAANRSQELRLLAAAAIQIGQADYFSTTNEIEGRPWLVLISAKGFMETAFPPDDMQDYIVQSKYVFLGKLKELIQ